MRKNWYDGVGFVNDMAFNARNYSVKDWLWAIAMMLFCRDNPQYRVPYIGLSPKRARLLMWLRGEQPMTGGRLRRLESMLRPLGTFMLT